LTQVCAGSNAALLAAMLEAQPPDRLLQSLSVSVDSSPEVLRLLNAAGGLAWSQESTRVAVRQANAGVLMLSGTTVIFGKRLFHGRCLSVEIQFSTVYMHLATHAPDNHLVYEAIRESTGYLGSKDEEFHEFLQLLNHQYIDMEDFLRNETIQEGRFEIATGFILSGRVCCGDQLFRSTSPRDRFQRISESLLVVNKSLTLLSSHSYWSDESYDLEGKIVEFVVSFKDRGLAIGGVGTAKCFHGNIGSDGNGGRFSVHVGRSKFVVGKNGVEEVLREKKASRSRASQVHDQYERQISVGLICSI